MKNEEISGENGAYTTPLARFFYERSTLEVARDLLGKRLVRVLDGNRLAGVITETEAYIGETDLACHAHTGKSRRNAPLYGPPGIAYVYFTYGMHWLLNAVTEPEGFPAAVLIREIKPVEGLEIINQRRQGKDCSGPAKITQALGISREFNEIDLCSISSELWIEAGQLVKDTDIITSPRVGLFKVPEPWKSMPWRFRVEV
jgi:DNA-3-methyladenine glycosylase